MRGILGVFTKLLQRFLPGARKAGPWRRMRAGGRGRTICQPLVTRRTQSVSQSVKIDVEAESLQTRAIVHEGLHSAPDDGSGPALTTDSLLHVGQSITGDSSRSMRSRQSVYEHGRQSVYEHCPLFKICKLPKLRSKTAMTANLNNDEKNRDRESKTACIAAIEGAESSEEMIDAMGGIKRDWLVGLDALPGNIYAMSALRWGSDMSLEAFAKTVAFFCVFVIQLVGPPGMLWQYCSGHGLDDSDKLQWDKITFKSVASLSDLSALDGYSATKLLASCFVTLFILNGLICNVAEYDAWMRINRVLRTLNEHKMKDSCVCFHSLGAFMNSWVIFWLSLDSFLVLGCSETMLEVMMDALGLAFLYNLDDIGGDLGLVNDDDWPGLEFAWIEEAMSNNMFTHTIAEPSRCIVWSFFLFNAVLAVMSVYIPVLFIFTPFQEIRPQPFAQEIMSEAWLREFILNTTRATEL